jgi:hypothetical protein
MPGTRVASTPGVSLYPEIAADEAATLRLSVGVALADAASD